MQAVSMRGLRALGILGMNARNINYIGRYNQRCLYPLVDDKLKTKKLAQRYNVPAPALHFVIREQHRLRHIEGLKSTHPEAHQRAEYVAHAFE